MKKKILFLTLMVSAIAFTGCKKPHEHQKTDWQGDDASHWHECLGCEEILDKADHDFGDWKTTKEATEKEEGSKERSCKVCAFKEVDSIEKLAHEHVKSEWVISETEHHRTCSSCSEILDKGEHTFGEWTTVKAATETEKGLKERSCTACSYKEDEVIPLVNHTHIESDWLKDDESHWKYCSVCEENYDVNEHNYGEAVETILATTASGILRSSCVDCGKIKQETIPAFKQVGKLVQDKSWANYEAFDIYARRNAESISVRLISRNEVFTSEGRNSQVEVYFVTGDNLLSREGNTGVTRVTVSSSKQLTVYNYGQDVSSVGVKHSVKSVGTRNVVDIEVPYTTLNTTSDAIFGIACGLWSQVDVDWAPMVAFETSNVVDVEKLKTYIRCDKDNYFFNCEINDYPENIVQPDYDKVALTEGYPFGFANPENVLDENADDFYLKTSKTETGFKFDMVGFGTFADNEHVKLVIHTSETDGTGWATQASDVTFLVSKTKAIAKTGLTSFWDCVNFTEGDTPAANTPVYEANEAGYFKLSFTINFTEIPEYKALNKITFMALEFWGGNIYNGTEVAKAMTKNGVGVGDPALQSSYQVLQEKTLSVDKNALIADYNYQFSTDYYANVTKGEEGMTLNIISFIPVSTSNFIRFVVDVDGVAANHRPDWPIDSKDVSFTIYTDKAYIATGNTWFWDNEANKFHNGDETLNIPTVVTNEDYYTLELFIQYDELGLDISQESNLKGVLIAFHDGGIQNHGFNYKGTEGRDPANQNNYFTL